MRTQEEIVARYEAIKADDMLGFRADVLIGHLDFEHARPYLRADATADEWRPDPLDAESLRKGAADYAVFAWKKVQNHRGISASRSVTKLTEFAWLLGDEALVAEIERTSYPQYGAPKLKLVCERLGFPVPDAEPLQRMMRGEPCRDDCDEGCGG